MDENRKNFNLGVYKKIELNNKKMLELTNDSFIKFIAEMQKKQLEILKNIPSPVIDELKNFQKITTVIDSSIFSKFTRGLEKVAKAIQKKEPIITTQFEKLYENGWILTGDFDETAIVYSDEYSQEYLNERLANYYKENKYENFFNELDCIKDFFDKQEQKGFSTQIEIIKNILKDNMYNYYVAIPSLFPILEYLVSQKENILNTSEIIRYNNIKKVAEVKSQLGGKMIGGLYLVEEIYLYKLFLKMFAGDDFSKGIDATSFSRHSVLHGRYNPKRFDELDLIKLVCIISATTLYMSVE